MGDLSLLKNRFFPSFYKNEAPKLIEFFRYYLEWMEVEGNPYWTINNISDFTSINGSIDTYIEHLKNELMIDFPIEYAGDLRYIMKHLVMLYQSKGTVDSFKFFFRAIYNSFCEISYPRKHLLKVSDGKWSQGYFIYTKDIEPNKLSELLGKTVIEVETGISGLVNDTLPHYFTGESEFKYVLSITDNIKQFTVGNTLRVYDSQETFTISQAEYSKGYWENTDGFISADKLIQDGYYYQNFSYEITSLISIEEYKDIVERLFHPAGFKMFGNVRITESIEPMEKDDITFLRWWILHLFMHVLAQEKEMLLHSIIIKNNPDVYQFPWTSDQQYYNKQYGLVSNVSDMTPNDLYNTTNESNKMVFHDGKLIIADWANYKINSLTEHYDVVGIHSKYPIIKTVCNNGIIHLNNDQLVSNIPFIFIDGIKINDSHITKTKSGFTIATGISGNTVIFSLNDNIIKRVIKTNLTTNIIKIPYSEKRQIVPFINGEFVWDTVKYENNNLILSQSTGNLELYEFINNETLFVEHYYNTINEINTLYYKNPLRNITSKLTNNDHYYVNTLSYKSFEFPWTSDQQYYNKQYGLVSNVSDMTPNDLYNTTNESNKMVFHDGKLIEPNWGTYSFDNIVQMYCISGIRAAAQRIKTTCNNGNIRIFNKEFLKHENPFIFVNGIKIKDEDVIKTENGYEIPSTYNGNTVIYFLQNNIIKRTIKKQILNNNKNIEFNNSNKQQFIVFLNGEFVWNECFYNRNWLKLPKSKGYVELYEFINNEDLFTFEYIIENENNKTLFCYKPLRNIVSNVTNNDYYYKNNIKYKAYTYPWTNDLQYYYKQYDKVENIKDITPNELLTLSNASNKLVFINGKLIEPNWGTYSLPFASRKYCISSIRANKYVLKTECINGRINIEKDIELGGVREPFIFINGKKIRDSYVIKTSTGYIIASGITGTATIFFLKKGIISRTLKSSIKNNNKNIFIENPNKQQSILFLDGEFVWNTSEWLRNRVKLPKSKGYVELYEFINNEDLFTFEYDTENDNNTSLYCYNTLEHSSNYIKSNIDKNDYILYNSIDTFKFPYTYDQQYYNKQYGLVSNVSDMTPNDLYNTTNESNKMVFHDGKLIIADWANMKLPIVSNNYCISGIRSQFNYINTICINGIINCNNYNYNNPFIFVNGIKIKDEDVIKTENGYEIPSTYNGNTVIYFPDVNSITRSIKQFIINNNNIIELQSSNKNRYIVFIDGYFNWNNTEYDDKYVKLPYISGYVELYEFINNENLFTFEYKINNKNNKTLFCYNPIKSLRTYK